MTTVNRLEGTGKLVTRDGNYRAGRYRVEIRSEGGSHLASAAGEFLLDPGAGERGPDEEFHGAATLVLDTGEEADVEVAGRDGSRVEIVGMGTVGRNLKRP